MGHLAFTPQSIYINSEHTTHVQRKKKKQIKLKRKDALILQEAGCFELVLEKILHNLQK